MRKLTIKREKSFVGCVMKMQVYIEDATSDELTMTVENGEKPLQISCRKIGELKNGEEATFEIGEEATKVFVIADKLSKDYCNDCYRLPEGSEDISLSGRNKFNPATGNAFRFNGNDGRVATIGRQRGMKRGLIVLIAFILLGFLIGYGLTAAIFGILDARDKTFTAGNMSITLNESFQQQTVFGYSAVYSSEDVAVFVSKDTSLGTTAKSEEDYARAVISYNGFDAELKTDGELTCFIFNNEGSDGVDYSYYAYVYKTDDAYWLFQFAVEKKDARKYADDISEWAGSVSFK